MPADDTYPGLPRNLYLEVTNRCNLKCRACILYRGSWEPPRDITLEELIRITDQLPELQQIALHGIGEPLLNQDLPAMIRHLKNRDVSVQFNSNGILLDESRQSDLIAAGLDELRISLDAASPQGYKAMRDSNQFDQIVKNLRSFVDRIRHHPLSHLKLSLWYLGTSENIDELPDFIRLAASIGVGEVYAQVSKNLYATKRIFEAPDIDGFIGEEAWKNAEVDSISVQYMPYNGKRSSKKSEFRILYDDKAFYIAAILYDNPDSVLSGLGRRDDAFDMKNAGLSVRKGG